ncbi:MAG: L,D-transpeptidase family protein, partial [Proteobacteria bacterium]|nr:L,D-transpeptidase family protein [Pseudomonadota bacterium]
ILPPAPRQGVVINLPELRLYYYPPGTNTVVTAPVGIGREGWATPLGVTRVVAKEKDPYWYPTESVRADAERLGHPIPKMFPPGPDNPLGNYVMRLAWNTYLIHGTNNPAGVGLRSSAGCIRMYPEDIESIYKRVPVGTQVRVINEPLKMAWENEKLYVEVHPLLSDEPTPASMDTPSLVNKVSDIARAKNALIQWSAAKSALAQPTGIPTVIASKANKNGEQLGME